MGNLLTTGQAARALGVSHSTIRNAIRGGELRCAGRTRGGHARIEADEVERFRAATRRPSDGTCLPALDYRAMLDGFSDAMIASDGTHRIVHANAAAETLLGWPPGELIGRPLTTIIPPHLRAAHEAGFARYVDTHAPTLIGRVVRVPVLRHDGTEADVELRLSSIRAGEGHDLIVASLHDLRRHVELERQLSLTRYVRATARAAATLDSRLDIEHVLQTVVETLVGDFDAALARAWLYDAATDTLCLRAEAGSVQPPPALAQEAFDIARSSFGLAAAARTHTPVVENDITAHPYIDQAWAAREGLVAVAWLPLVGAGELRGVLVYCSRRALDEEVIEALSGFATIVSTSLNDIDLLAREQALRATAEASAAEASAQARRLALVQQTARELAVTTSVQELCNGLVQAIHARMGRHIVGAFLREGDELRLMANCVPGFTVLRGAVCLPLGHGIVGQTGATRRPYLCHDTEADPYYERLHVTNTRAEMAVPIQAGSDLVGVLNVESPHAGAFDEDDLSTLVAIADQAAIAIQNARLYERESELRLRAETRAPY